MPKPYANQCSFYMIIQVRAAGKQKNSRLQHCIFSVPGLNSGTHLCQISTLSGRRIFFISLFSLFWKKKSAKLVWLALDLLCSLGRPGTSHPPVSASWIASITGLHQQGWPTLHINFTSSWMVTLLFNPTRYLYQLPFIDSLVCGPQVPRCLCGGRGQPTKVSSLLSLCGSPAISLAHSPFLY